MFDFEYYAPTKVVFGKSAQDKAGELLKEYGAKKSKISVRFPRSRSRSARFPPSSPTIWRIVGNGL